MRRRKFIRNVGLASLSAGLATSIGKAGALVTFSNPQINSLRSFTLSGFSNEQEECPHIVTDGDDSWLFTLRRLEYPNDAEVISQFKMQDDEWVEQEPVIDSGKYEHLVTSCAPNGKPVIAFCKLDNSEWNISVVDLANKSNSITIKPPKGKYTKPVLITPKPGKIWVAWESYEKGRFSIYLKKFEDNRWFDAQQITSPSNVCMDPAIAEAPNGDLFVAFGIMDGFHQNIRLKIFDGDSMAEKQDVPIAIGGGLKDRVNYNTKPALTFDKDGRLWIAWESNRKTTRLEDSDNFIGDRICGVVAVQDGKVLEPVTGKWVFDKKNDHLPTFVKDQDDNLYLFTICGGDFEGKPFWKYRVSWLDPKNGWVKPITFYGIRKKGQMVTPSVIFKDNRFCLATRFEAVVRDDDIKNDDIVEVSVRSKLEIHEFAKPEISAHPYEIGLKKTVTEEYHDSERLHPFISGRARIDHYGLTYEGVRYKLAHGNLHEHSEISTCWPAGCDGTLHDDYRYGMYTEGYHFMAMTDHAENIPVVYWRKSLRLVDFYNDPPFFVALPAVEWSLPNGKENYEIARGVGHRNIIFRNAKEALKFIKDKEKLYSKRTVEAARAQKMLDVLHRKKIDCISIPHHPADEVHPMDWEVFDQYYEPLVEIFQCRGNAEYPGCPREINVSRHRPTSNPKAYIDYALREKKYKLGFIASGDHNEIGVGLASVLVREVNAKEIFESLRKRYCFATTGDKIFIDFRINDMLSGGTVKAFNNELNISFLVKAIRPIKSIELLHNSTVVDTFSEATGKLEYSGKIMKKDRSKGGEGGYYYLRITQTNNHIGWSSPIWILPA